MEIIENPNVPSDPRFIIIKHPANNREFFKLPANNTSLSEPSTFGIHHSTALYACLVLAGEPGFLSSSGDRQNIEDRAPQESDAILTLDEYYYHFTVPPAVPLYPICLDFALWEFPRELPVSWRKPEAPAAEEPSTICDSWTLMSSAVKLRDVRCRLSGWRDMMTTAHIIPREEEDWMRFNRLRIHAKNPGGTIVNDPRNLFALRWDLYSLLFDQAKWVVVPKNGEMVVHFIGQSFEAAPLYHNQMFNTQHLSHEFLFARFAWAIIKRASSMLSLSCRKQFSLVMPMSDAVGNDAQAGAGSMEKQKTKKRKISDVSGSGIVDEAQELADDLALAERIAPFFFEEPNARKERYHSMMWYPGWDIVQRRKQEYMDAHPNIRAYSDACPTLTSDDSDEGEDDSRVLSD